VSPADDDVAAFGVVAVVAERAAFEFKLDSNALPFARADLALGFKENLNTKAQSSISFLS